MTPAARLAAVIELLELTFEASQPADQVVTGYLRQRRYIGSKDRRAINERYFALLRHLYRLSWHLEVLGSPPEPRPLALAQLHLVEKEAKTAVLSLFEGGGYGPAPLTKSEEALLDGLAGRDLEDDAMPPAARAECPSWLWPRMEAAFCEHACRELARMAEPAPLDLRVNSLKATRGDIVSQLAAEGFDPRETPYSPWGLRIEGRPALTGSRILSEGLVEPQDEASQLAALLMEAKPGMTLLDYCAGAGGKSLALGAAMENRGRLLLYDKDPRRLGRSTGRIERAGLTIARSFNKAKDLKDYRSACDGVLVDAPCSASGRWRREPDGRRRLSEERLRELTRTQAGVLEEAADYVKPGGHLLYATCSILPEENEDIVNAFLVKREDFRALDLAERWEVLNDGPLPAPGPYFTLTPRRNETDGFFIALLRRS